MRTFVLLILVALEVCGPLAAMVAGNGLLRIGRMSSSIKPCYQPVLLHLLVPSSCCGMEPSPSSSSRGGGVGSVNLLRWQTSSEPSAAGFEALCRVARPAACRRGQERGRRWCGPRGVDAQLVPGRPARVAVSPCAVVLVSLSSTCKAEEKDGDCFTGAPTMYDDLASVASWLPTFFAAGSRRGGGHYKREADGAFAALNPILSGIVDELSGWRCVFLMLHSCGREPSTWLSMVHSFRVNNVVIQPAPLPHVLCHPL